MPRKRRFTEPLDQYKVRRQEDDAEAERLREEIFRKLVRYRDRLGEAEVLRRLRIDCLEESDRVQVMAPGPGIRLLGNHPLTEDHPTVQAIDARLAELAAEEEAGADE